MNELKKLLLISLVILFILGILNAQELSIELGYFIPSDQTFKDIYGSGIQYGGKLSVEVLERLSVWLGGSYFSKKGELTYTKEEITLRIIPINFGIQYRFSDKKIIPYISVGLGIHFFSEFAPRGNVSYARFGYTAQTGFLIRITEKFHLSIGFDYKQSKINPKNTDINIGGFCTSFGLKYRF